jgi:type IX secretion system PorP/SprF family membrane protein
MKLVFYLIVFLSPLFIQGQNLYRFGHYNFTKSVYNPAALGADASFTADLVYRNQWRGIDGAPQTGALNASYDLNQTMAVGINFYNDRIGLNQTNSFSAQYSYRLLFDERKYLAFGVGLGGDNFAWNWNSANANLANDPVFSGSYSVFRFNGSFGMYYRTPRFYAGFSIPQFFQNTSQSSRLDVKQLHYLFMSGYYFELSDDFILSPSAQLKIVPNAPIQADFLVRGIYQFMGLSVGYRTENSFLIGVECMLKEKVRVGYMFNYDIGKLARVKGGSGEIYLGLGLPYYFNKTERSKYIGKNGGFNKGYKKAARKQQLRRP